MAGRWIEGSNVDPQVEDREKKVRIVVDANEARCGLADLLAWLARFQIYQEMDAHGGKSSKANLGPTLTFADLADRVAQCVGISDDHLIYTNCTIADIVGQKRPMHHQN